MKHIKLKGTLTSDKKHVEIALLEQTHFDKDFSDQEGLIDEHSDRSLMFCSNKVLIVSCDGANIQHSRSLGFYNNRYKSDYYFYVAARADRVNSSNTTRVTLAQWSRIVAAVTEYNAFHRHRGSNEAY